MDIIRVSHKYDLLTHTLTCFHMFSPLSSLLATSAHCSQCHRESLKHQSRVFSKRFSDLPLWHSRLTRPLPDSDCHVLSTPSIPLHPPSMGLLLPPCLHQDVFIFALPSTILLPPLGKFSPFCLANSCFPFKTQFRHHFFQKAFPDHHCPTETSY